MQEPRNAPNPLRPYYVPPSIGESATSPPNITANTGTPSSSSFSFPNIDYADYIPDASPSALGSAKSLLDQTLWKYTSVMLAQPFEVAKLILQVRIAQEDDLEDHTKAPRTPSSGRNQALEQENDSSDEEPNFFASQAPFEGSPRFSPTPRGRQGRPSLPSSRPQSYQQSKPQSSPNTLDLKNSHSLLDALSSLSSSSGSLSIWRGTNTTFVYTILTRTLETFLRSFLATLIGVSEPDILVPLTSSAIPDPAILASTSPLTTILISTAATALAALVLAPIDAARTRLILTPSSDEPRSLLGTLKTLRTPYLIPSHLLPITFLTSTLPNLISNSAPFFLRSYLRIDPNLNPTSWSVATFMSSTLDLCVRFPLETVLRRAQISTWTAPNLMPPSSSSKRKAIKTIVPVPQSYKGVIPTMWGIMREEGYSESQRDKTAALMGKAPRRKRKGQGVEGLFRGWRVGLWGLVGVWGTSFVGGLQQGAEGATATGIHGGKF